MMPSATVSNRAGFSLLEVLAALAMTLLLVLVLTPFVRQMLATWARGSEAVYLVELKTRGIGSMRGDLQNAVAWSGYGEADALGLFRGDKGSLEFPAVVPNSQGGGIEYLAFTVELSVDGKALVRRRALMTGTTNGPLTDPIVLASGPYSYIFQYYTREGERVSDWPKDKFDLPGVVELDILDGNGRLIGTPFMMPTFASFSAACFVSADLRGCSPLGSPPADEELMKSWGLTAAGR